MVDFKKALDAAKLSMIIVIVLGVVFILISLVPVLGLLAILSLPINLALFAYAGYKSTKIMKQDLVTAGVAGALAALISHIPLSLIRIIMVVAGFSPAAAAMADTPYGAMAGTVLLGVVLVQEVILLILSPITNFVVGLVGGFIGQKM